MKISVQVIVDHENGDPTIIKSMTTFKREDLTFDTVGLTIEESKLLLINVQSEFVNQQVEQYICNNKTCNKTEEDADHQAGEVIDDITRMQTKCGHA